MTALLILGMHRSGTSALAGSLQQQGVYLDKVFEWNPHNPKGNRENSECVELNESVLSSNNGNWANPPSSITWTPEQAESRNRIITKFVESNSRVWGFKDPRTLFTLDFWLDGLEGIHTMSVGSFRHPLPVAKSLMTRNKIPLEEGYILWEKYNTRLLDLQRKTRFPLVSFDVAFDEYHQAIRRVLTQLGMLAGSSMEDPFFDHSLRHETLDHSALVPSTTLELYEELTQIYKDQSQWG
jgi:hypothetical protein